MKHWTIGVLTLLGACTQADYGSDGGLAKVSGADATHVWAIGSGTAGDRVFKLDHGGASVSQQFAGETLTSLDAISTDDVWVVGGSIHHYDGHSWSTLAMPSDPIFAIGDGWAVGMHGTIYQPGATFAVLSGPDSRIDLTVAIQAAAWADRADDVWVSDGTHLFAFDGSWSDKTPASAIQPLQLQSITGTGPDDVWTSSFAGQQFHFDGSQWTVTGDGANDDLILGMWANTADDVWAVGYSNILLHWDGQAWAPQAAPPVLRCDGAVVDGNATTIACTQDVSLSDVWGSSATDVWVVGYFEEAIGGTPLLFHYDGAAWTDLSPS